MQLTIRSPTYEQSESLGLDKNTFLRGTIMTQVLFYLLPISWKEGWQGREAYRSDLSKKYTPGNEMLKKIKNSEVQRSHVTLQRELKCSILSEVEILSFDRDFNKISWM